MSDRQQGPECCRHQWCGRMILSASAKPFRQLILIKSATQQASLLLACADRQFASSVCMHLNVKFIDTIFNTIVVS